MNSKPHQWANQIGKSQKNKGNKDTKYSGNMKAKAENGKASISLTGGKMETTNRGPSFTKKGQEHEITGSRINDGKKKGYELSYANRQITGKGYKVGNSEFEKTNTRERKATVGATKGIDGRKGIHTGYEDTKTNTKSIKTGGMEMSRSDYNTRSYSGEIGGKKTSQGYNIDTSLSRKDVRGREYQIGKRSYAHEKEKGTEVKGVANIDKSGVNVRGSIENYDKTSHKFGYGDMKGEVSQKNYQNREVNTRFNSKNGVITSDFGASYATGREYNGKLGGVEATLGKENKFSALTGMRATQNEVTANAQIQNSQKYSAYTSLGDIYSARASAAQTQTAQATMNKYGVQFKGNYERAFDANAHTKFGNTEIDARGRFSDNTFGSANAQLKNGQFNARANLGKEYNVGAGLALNGKNVASMGLNARGEVGANVNANKNGVSAEAELNGQAQASAAFGKHEVKASIKSDIHVDVGFDLKSGFHFNKTGGVHVETEFKNKNTGKKRDDKIFILHGENGYILCRKRKISSKKNMKKAHKNKILGQICRPSKRRF